MITISFKEKMTPTLLAFVKKEWEIADREHYGKAIDWKKQTLFITAIENKQLIGLLELTYDAGVMYIQEVIVAHTHHNNGIGTMLMLKAEDIAKKEKLHKIYLETGKDWSACKFYEKLGYIKTGELPKHSMGKDYVHYSKFL